VPIVYKLWSLNLLEPQEHVQACSWKALPLHDNDDDDDDDMKNRNKNLERKKVVTSDKKWCLISRD
jgi:hypothetical protein